MTSRYIQHNQQPFELKETLETIHNALYNGIQEVQKHVIQDAVPGSVYVGIEGIALMETYISRLELYPEEDRERLNKHAADLVARSLLMLAQALAPVRSGGKASFLETGVGTATMTILFSLHGDTTRKGTLSSRSEECIRRLHGAVRTALDEPLSEDGCEVLYGRAGLLYGLLLIRKHLPFDDVAEELMDLVRDDNLMLLVDDIMKRGKHGAAVFRKLLPQDAPAPSLMWSWHGKRYLGGAHGIAGILQMLLSCPSNVIAPHMSKIVDTIGWLVDLQDREGNWPHKASSRDKYDSTNELIQWCHGAPAVLILVSILFRRANTSRTISRMLPDASREAMREAVIKGAHIVYTRGLLRKGTGLCHGVAGSVFALLAAAEAFATTDGVDSPLVVDQHKRAAHLAVLAADWQRLTSEGTMSTPDRPCSLYEGLSGMCCAWAAVAHTISGGRTFVGMPGYDDLI